jgi:uncharacterized protein (DUF2236 family)
LSGPGSQVWRVWREKTLLLGGPAAVLLQLAHPLIAAGVAAHSSFRADPLRRLRAVLDTTLTVTFGDRRQATAAAARVGKLHRRVQGRLPVAVGCFPAGSVYRASDPRLALWVHATLVVVALDVVDQFVSSLTTEQRARYYQESKPFAVLFATSPRSSCPTATRTSTPTCTACSKDPNLPSRSRRASLPPPSSTAGCVACRARRIPW